MSKNIGPEYVRAIAPYQSGKPIAEVAREFGLDEAAIVKLASNENPYGMPESAKLAMIAAIDDLGRYPDANGFDLKAVLSKRYDVPADWITLGNGSNDILETAAQLEAFLQKVPQHVVVVLDEAYNEFLSADEQYESTAWVRQYPNLVVSRTLSKAYGLAGLRIGFAIAQPVLTDLMNRIRQPFNVNSLAQAAAIAALNDKDFLEQSARNNAAGYQQFIEAFTQLGLEFVPSHGNFVLVKVGDDDEAGARVNLALLQQGVIVRPVGSYGLPQWLRISIGLPQENAIFIAALTKALA